MQGAVRVLCFFSDNRFCICTSWPRANNVLNEPFPGRSWKKDFWVLENLWIWSLQVLESREKKHLHVCMNTVVACVHLISDWLELLIRPCSGLCLVSAVHLISDWLELLIRPLQCDDCLFRVVQNGTETVTVEVNGRITSKTVNGVPQTVAWWHTVAVLMLIVT